MKVIIYSKEGCQYCDHAKTYASQRVFDYEKVMVDKEELKKVCGGSVQLTLKYLLTIVTSEPTLTFRTT